MIATRYSVKCERCGGESAPIICGRHTSEEYCEAERQRILDWLGKVEGRLIERINSEMPADSVPDHIAIPRLNRLERRQQELESAFRTIRLEVRAI